MLFEKTSPFHLTRPDQILSTMTTEYRTLPRGFMRLNFSYPIPW
jgi:hypothetical protein